MKFIKFLSLSMAIVLSLCVLIGCEKMQPGEEITVNCKILTDKGEKLYDEAVTVTAEEPKIYDVVCAIMDSSEEVEISLNDNNKIRKINNLEEKDIENNSSYFWNIILNEKDANINDSVKDGSNVTIQYTLFQPEIKLVIKNGDEEIFNNSVIITEFDDESNQISVINVLKTAEEQFEDLDIGFYKKDGKETNLKSVNELVAGADETTKMTGKWTFFINGNEIKEKHAYEFMVTSGDSIDYKFTQEKTK